MKQAKTFTAIFELDGDREAIGQVLHFCTPQCCDAAEKINGYSSPRFARGTSNEWVAGDTCSYCGLPLEGDVTLEPG